MYRDRFEQASSVVRFAVDELGCGCSIGEFPDDYGPDDAVVVGQEWPAYIHEVSVVFDPGLVCSGRCYPDAVAVWSIVHKNGEEHVVLAVAGEVGVGVEE